MLKYCIIPKKSIYRSRVKLYTSLILNQKSIHCQMIDMHGLSFSSDRPYFTNSVAKLTKLINKVSFVLSSQDLFLTSYNILQTLAGLFLILVASISFLPVSALFLFCNSLQDIIFFIRMSWNSYLFTTVINNLYAVFFWLLFSESVKVLYFSCCFRLQRFDLFTYWRWLHKEWTYFVHLGNRELAALKNDILLIPQPTIHSPFQFA